MKKSLDQYINKIKEKTIFIYCNDCYEGNLITPTDNLMVHTLFGNMINFSDVFELEYLEHNIQFEGVTKILLSGHYKCEILNYINNSCTQNLKLNLSNMEFERMNAKRKDDGKKALQ